MQHLSTEKQHELSAKWLSGTITPEELELLEAWYNQQPQGNMDWEAGDYDEKQLKERLFYNIRETQKAEAPVRRLNTAILFKAAAVLLLAFACGVYYTKTAVIKPEGTVVKLKRITPHKPVNNNKAVLTLANGSTMVLDNAGNGVIAKQGSARINKTHDGELVYDAEDAADAKVEMNMVSTLSGGQYQIALPDGSRVWLNALTSLKFPTAFKGAKREVELIGEAYFEVAKNKNMPFVVKLADNTSIEVLGTHFDVMAYANEHSIKATLLEGSINVQKGTLNKVIAPGQEAKVTDQIKIKNVNAEDAIAWKNGLFNFDNAGVHNLMRQIERWYNVEVVYMDKVPDKHITGYISRSSSLTEVIKMLELSGLEITTEGKKLRVYDN